MNKKHFAVATVTAFTLTAGSALAAPNPPSGPQGGVFLPRVSSQCMEDMGCWIWSQMGNLHRGVVQTNGQRSSVGPCEYGWLRRHHVLNLKASKSLKGDLWALRTCQADTYEHALQMDFAAAQK